MVARNLERTRNTLFTVSIASDDSPWQSEALTYMWAYCVPSSGPAYKEWNKKQVSHAWIGNCSISPHMNMISKATSRTDWAFYFDNINFVDVDGKYIKAQGLYSPSEESVVLQPIVVKPRSRQIGCYNDRIALKFDRHLGSAADEVPGKFQRDRKSLNSNLAASKLH